MNGNSYITHKEFELADDFCNTDQDLVLCKVCSSRTNGWR